MAADWDNFIRGISRTALETERLPHLVDPELERPGGLEDTRMRTRHGERREAFYEGKHGPQKVTALEAKRLTQIREAQEVDRRRREVAVAYRALRASRRTA
ncbi:hypothetical protein AS850_02855 [Frondihabitans sp. 762G35]|uniref:hypothetical protein n=1 Tax=Frondihabitans sp. 762G35 TaxID=1446794 RepID=UPI000D20DE36|nr:hypothetical protein [Frondihabitans sp. 762G35]ARC56012.1 hypothetical protein AS850_02855 [Frondihabitans sp. 762G35]